MMLFISYLAGHWVFAVSPQGNVLISIVYWPQEIYLEKNGTSQLGVTLGYDVQTAKGQLYVCEVRMTIFIP